MNAILAGMGWVTPLGRDLETVRAALEAGVTVEPQFETPPNRSTPLPVLRIPPALVRDAAALPRLRRSSVISHFAVAAAVDAAAELTSEQLARTALIFTATDGGVHYTRRFFGDIIERGPGAGSPLLFPETVYNAPASHIAARLGLDRESLTLVGDIETGLDAIQTACELLACGDVDYCLVAAAQEIDWIACEAYARWGLVASPTRPGAILSEGAAAVLLAREGSGRSVQVLSNGSARITNPKTFATIAAALPATPDVIVSSASGTRFSATEYDHLRVLFPETPLLTPKITLGEAMVCSSIQQVILAALTLENSGKSHGLAITTGCSGRISALFLTQSSSHE